MDTETLQNASYTVMADEENKILLLSAPGKKGFAPGQQDLDKYLAYCSSVKFTEDKTYKIYTLAFKKGTVEFSEIVLYIDKKSYLFGKMTVYMHPSKELTESGYAEGQAPRMEISYSKIKTDPKFGKDEFSEKNFISHSGGKFTACGKYKGYRVLNHLLNP
jgi:hypothetical protein